MTHSLFTSESVSVGHPDKVADQISDAILDEALRQDTSAKVACETLVTKDTVILSGEITTTAKIDYEAIARRTIREIGYIHPGLGFDDKTCKVLCTIHRQSPDIAMGVEEGKGLFKEQGAGDQGMMFGYACDETDVLMPLPITLANRLVDELRIVRESGQLPYLMPDGKVQVTIEYDENLAPIRIHTLVLSTQHTENVTYEEIERDMKALAKRVIGDRLIDEKTIFFINPTGRFVVGGPTADCGLTGRKTMVDTYGSTARHGGGAFSGKDPSKVDRSGAYAARYVAKNIVASGLASRCEVQIAYAIGVAKPVSIKVDTFGTSIVPEAMICSALTQVFDLSPKGISEMLDLCQPIYRQVAYGGHFGRADLSLPWERCDRIDELLEALDLVPSAQPERPSSFAFSVAMAAG